MPSLWFPVEELISDKVDRAQKLWDERVGKQTIKAGAAQVNEPLIQDRIGSAMSRFDTLTAGPARGLMSGLSGPSGPLTALNPIAAGSAIGADLFPKAAPKVADRIGEALRTPSVPTTARKPIETPGLGLAPLGTGIEEKIKGAGSKFDSLIKGAGSTLKQRDTDFSARLQKEGIDLGTGSTVEDFVRNPLGTTRKEWDYRPKPLPLRGDEGDIEGGVMDTANQMRESYNFLRDKPERLVEGARVIGEHTSVPGAITSMARAQRERPGDKKAYLSQLGDTLETAGHVGNLIPTGEDTLQNLAVNIGVRKLTKSGVNPLVAAGLSVAGSILAPALLPLAKRGVIRVNANAEQMIGQAIGVNQTPAITSAEKSRIGAMQQINWMKTGKRKDGVTDAFPFEYDTTQVRNTKSGRPIEYASSSTELEAMLRLEKNDDVASWRRPDDEADIIPYRMDNGETGSYVPDFIVKYKDGRTEVIEIKAAFREEQPGVKARSKAAQQWAADRGYEYALVTERELGEASLRARAKEDPSLFVGVSPHMTAKFQALIERSSTSAGRYAPRAFDPTRTQSVALAGRAQPPSAKGRTKTQPLTEADLEVLEIIREQQLSAGNTKGAERTLGMITDTRARLGIEGPRGTSSDLDYPEPVPDDPETIKYNEREAGKLFLRGTAIRSGAGASAGAASGAIYGEQNDLPPEERAAAIGVGALAGGALGAGVHATGYKGLAALIDAGKVNKQYLQGHPDLANRVRAIMLAAAERTPAGRPVEVPTAVQSLERLSTGNGLEGLSPELLRLTSGQLTAEQVRDLIGRATPLSKVWQASKDLLADAVSGLPLRFQRAEEFRADKSALYNLKSVGIDRATSVEDLVRRVADAVGTATPTVKIIDSPDVNAFAPVNGQPLGLTSGLMDLGLSREELAWIIAHELTHTTTEGRSKRMKWLVSRVMEKGGKAEGQASGGLAERFSRHKVLMEGRLSQYDQLTTRMAAAKQGYETRRMQIEMRKASNGIQRPPSEGVWAEWGGTFTDNDLMEIAARSGDVQSFGPQWWEAVDPRVVREYKAEVMSERGTRKVPPRTMKSYSDEMDAIERQKNQLEQQLEEDMNISSNLEEQAAQEGVDLTLDDEIEAPSADYDDMGASTPDPNRFARPIEGTDAGPIIEPEPVAKQELPARKAEQNALDLGDQSVAPTTTPLVNPKNQTQLGMGLDVPEAAPASRAAARTEADRAARGLEQAPIDLEGTAVSETAPPTATVRPSGPNRWGMALPGADTGLPGSQASDRVARIRDATEINRESLDSGKRSFNEVLDDLRQQVRDGYLDTAGANEVADALKPQNAPTPTLSRRQAQMQETKRRMMQQYGITDPDMIVVPDDPFAPPTLTEEGARVKDAFLAARRAEMDAKMQASDTPPLPEHATRPTPEPEPAAPDAGPPSAGGQGWRKNQINDQTLIINHFGTNLTGAVQPGRGKSEGFLAKIYRYETPDNRANPRQVIVEQHRYATYDEAVASLNEMAERRSTGGPEGTRSKREQANRENDMYWGVPLADIPPEQLDFYANENTLAKKGTAAQLAHFRQVAGELRSRAATVGDISARKVEDILDNLANAVSARSGPTREATRAELDSIMNQGPATAPVTATGQGLMDLGGVETAPPGAPGAPRERTIRHPGEVKADADTLFDELEPEVERGNLSPQQVHARLDRHMRAGDISATEMARIKEGLKPAYAKAPPPATITDSAVTTPSGPRTESQEAAYNRVIADIEDAQTRKDPGVIAQTIRYHGFSAEDQADLHAQLAQKLEELERAGVPPYLDGDRIDYLVKLFGPKIKRGRMTVEQAAGQLKAMLDRGEIGPQTYSTAHFRLENDHNAYLAGKRKAAIKAGAPDTTGEGTWRDEAPTPEPESVPEPAATPEPETPPAATPEPEAPAAPTPSRFSPEEVAQSKREIRQAIDEGLITADEANAKIDELVRTGEIDQAAADQIRPEAPAAVPEAPEAPEAPAAAATPSGDAAAAQARSAARAAEFGSTSDFNPETYQRLMDEYGPQLKSGENFIEGIEKDLARREAAGEVDYDTAKEVVEDLRRQNGLPTDTTVPETPDQAAAPEVDPIPEEAGTVEALPEIEPIPAEPERPDMTIRPQAQPLPDAPDTASDIGTMLPPEPEVPPTPAPAPRAERAERGPGKKALRNQVQQHVDQMLDSDEMTPDEIQQAITDMADAGTITDWQAMEASEYLKKQLNMRAVNGQPETGPIPGQINAAMGRQLDRRAPPPVERRGKAPKEPEEPMVFESGEEGSAGYGDVTKNKPGEGEAPPREAGRAQTPDELAARQAGQVDDLMVETEGMSMEDALAHIDDKAASGEISQTVGNRAAAQIYDRAGQAPPVPTPEPEPVVAPGAPEGYPAGAPWPPPESGRPVPENLPAGPEGSSGFGDVTTPEAQAAEAAYPVKKSTLGVDPEDIIEPEPVPPRVPPTAEVAPPTPTTPVTDVPPPPTPRAPDAPDGTGAPTPPVPPRPSGSGVPPPPPPTGDGTGSGPPPPPVDPKGPAPANWPAGVPWPPPFDPKKEPSKWAKFWQKLDNARYSTNMLARPAGGVRDLLGTMFSLGLAFPRTAIASGIEGGIIQPLGGVKTRERSAVLGQSRQMAKAFLPAWKEGRRKAADVWQKGLKSEYASTLDAPNTDLFGTGTKWQRGLNRAVEAGYRFRLSSDAFNAHIGEEIATAGLAYREAVRAGLERGTKEFESFRRVTQADIKAEMQRLAAEAHKSGGKVPQGPVRPRADLKVAPPGMPRQMADTDTTGLAQEAFAIAKGLIFQQEPGFTAKNARNMFRGAMRGPVPMFATLANIGAQWVEHHPLVGTAGVALDLARSATGKAGDHLLTGPYAKVGTGPNAGNRFTSSNSAAVRPASQRIASATMGAGVASIAFGLVANGLMTDNGPSDTAVKRKMMNEGWRPLAIPFPDGDGGVAGYIPIEWLIGPLAGAAGFGAEQASRSAKDEEPLGIDTWQKILLNQSSQWAGTTGLRPVYDLMQAIMAPDDEEQMRSLEDLVGDMMGGALPAGGVLKMINDVAGDEYQRDPQNWQEWIASQIPGWREDVPMRTDEYGEPVRRGSTLTRLGNLVNPATYSEATPGTRAFFGSDNPEMDAEITRAINAVDNYRRHPDQYKVPTDRQYSLQASYVGARDFNAQRLREEETKERRRRKVESSQSIQDILQGNWGALTGSGGGGFVPPTSGSRPRFEIPRVGG